MKKVLIIRLSAIGDIVFASTILKPLKGSNEDIHLTWMVKSSFSPILLGNPFIDEVISLPIERWNVLKKEKRYILLLKDIYNFCRNLRSKKFDIAIDLHGILKGAIWAFISGAKLKIGLGKKELNYILLDKTFPRDGEKGFFGSEYLFLVESLGFQVSDRKPFIYLDEKVILNVKEKFLKNLSEFFVVAPFTTRPQKHWINNYWIDLLNMLNDSFPDKKIFILGGKIDYEYAKQFTINENIINLAGKTDLLEAAVLIYLSNGIIGVDTGLTHMGTAFEKPTIAIFGSTCPYLETTNINTKVLYANLECSPCRRNPICNNRFDCMIAIRPEIVFEEFKKIIGHYQ